MKYLRINLTKSIQDLYVYKIKNFIEMLEKTKINGKLFLFTHRFSVIKMLILPEFIYRFKTI